MPTDFTLPELGENVTTGDVLRVLVKPGDTLAKDQPVLELETDKATIEVPSSVSGQVKEVKVKAGDKVNVGQAILTVETAGQAEGSQAGGAQAEAGKAGGGQASAPAAGGGPKKEAKEIREVKQVEGAKRETMAPESARTSQTPQAADQPSGAARRSPGGLDNVVDIRGGRAAPEPSAPSEPDAPPVAAAPSVRRTARELGIDIADVPGSGPSGRISVEDIKAHARQLIEGAGGVATQAATRVPVPDFSRWGEIERQPMRAVRRKTAEHLAAAWASVPHVTQFDLADITALEEVRKKYAKQAESEGGNLTVTAIAVKVVAAALRRFPQFNASVDMAAGEIIYKKYVNIGIAVDTDRGLLVPVIKNADQKNIVQISVELTELSEKARNRKITLEEMQGGCFSISNLGGIGGTYFTPIVNTPELAVLGISRARWEPVYAAAQFVPHFMLPLSLSYDHRAIDGADGIRFLRWVAEALEQPFLLALNG